MRHHASNRVVFVTVGIVVLAGVLSAGAMLWHTRNVSRDYDRAIKKELEQKGLAYGYTATTFLDALGDDALPALEQVTSRAITESKDVVAGERERLPANGFANAFVNLQVWVPDASEERGYRTLYNVDFEGAGPEEVNASADQALKVALVDDAAARDAPAAAVVDSTEHLLIAFPMTIGSQQAFAVGTVSAHEEFAFFAAQQHQVFRNGIILAGVIIAFVSAIGIAASFLVSRDLTSRRRAEQELQRSETRYRTIFEDSPVALLELDGAELKRHLRQLQLRGTHDLRLYFSREPEAVAQCAALVRPVSVNNAAVELYRAKSKEEVLERWGKPFSPETLDLFRDGLAQFAAGATEFEAETTGKAFDGTQLHFKIGLFVPPEYQDTWAVVLLYVIDITEQKHAEEALRDQARRDLLTGALNHAAIVDELRQLVARADARSHAIAMVDVDGLKALNDNFGHQLGDAVLVAVANALRQDGVILGRYGGDEFVVILPGADRRDAEAYRRAVSERLANTHVRDPETTMPVSVSASIGLAVFPDDAATVTELIASSDTEMYARKRQRPNARPARTPPAA